TLGAYLEGRCQKRQCRWRYQGARKALNYASGDQHSAGLAESAPHRCPDEEDQTRHEHASPADDVSETTDQHEKAAKGERIAANHPLDVLSRQTQSQLHRGQRDVDDSDVKE